MADPLLSSRPGRTSFGAQANALLRKNLTYQKRNICVNIRLVCIPILLCLLLFSLQMLLEVAMNGSSNCGECKENCDLQSLEEAAVCPVRRPQEWPPLLQIPAPEQRAVRTSFIPFTDLPNESCRRAGTCPATVLLTGNNQSLGEALAGNMFSSSFDHNISNVTGSLANYVLGTATEIPDSYYLDPAFDSKLPIYSIERQCTPNSTYSINIQELGLQKEVRCVQGLSLWRNTSSEVNKELYKGYYKGNSEGKINEILAAYDFLNSNVFNFNLSIWYNSTSMNERKNGHSSLARIPRYVNWASNAYLQFLQGPGTQIQFEFVKEMPKEETKFTLDIASLIGPLFYTWVILQLFPVILTSLVYEKQQKLRIMMKMHGLGDGPYWMISYSYFLAISIIYMLCFVIFGISIGLNFFSLNDYRIQFIFYFIYVNLQIALAFLVASMFSNVKTASVVAYIFVFGTGLLGAFLFQSFLVNPSVSRRLILAFELYPGFSLFRGLYEFAQYASRGVSTGTSGMQWKDLSESGMKEVLAVMIIEWLVVLISAYYVDKMTSSGSRKSPLFFLQKLRKKRSSSLRKPTLQRQGSNVLVQMEKPDVNQEREKVEQLLLESSTSHAVICDNLKKLYPGRDGNPAKFAVKGLSLALPQGECFGMLGPNGAGKTSFISMMIGLTQPTSGTAFVQGLDIRTDMDGIYTSIGVCPQHDLLWETLTGREHLLFYGRIKNLKGSALTQAVEDSLQSVNLLNGGLADKQAGKYSGGMKRRLSVAISLIGNPQVVYMDEPSTGLDPASRNKLWDIVKHAKQDCAIILTTHSMEEAEALCDRLGIFVDGSLQCIGNAKELKARYGGAYVLTMTTSGNHEEEVEQLVHHLSPNANKIYHISGTQKFELPKHEVRIADVFQAVENAKSRFTVFAWGLADTTLEDVFIKVARGAQAFNVVS